MPQVMQLLADSSDDSGSDLNLTDLDIGGNSSASESNVEGATFQHQRRLSQHFRQQVLACHLVVVAFAHEHACTTCKNILAHKHTYMHDYILQ